MDVAGTNIVLAYPEAGYVRWVDSSGNEIKWDTVSAPQGVSVANDGTAYVTTGSEIVTTTGSGTTVFVTGLTNPGRLDIDHSNGDVYVITGANHEFVQRYSSSGSLLNTYGEACRRMGCIIRKRFTRWRILPPTAMAAASSFASRDYIRRVIQVNSSDGSILNIWYGGLPWCPWAAVDPDNPSVVWVEGNSKRGAIAVTSVCAYWSIIRTAPIRFTRSINWIHCAMALPRPTAPAVPGESCDRKTRGRNICAG